MSIDIERVRSFFLLFSDLPDRDAMRWDLLCRSAAKKIESRLRNGADIPANQERLCAAAAGWAYGDYLMIAVQPQGQNDEVKVGDISLKSSAMAGRKQDARELQAYFLNSISDLTTGDTQVFFAMDSAVDGDDI